MITGKKKCIMIELKDLDARNDALSKESVRLVKQLSKDIKFCTKELLRLKNDMERLDKQFEGYKEETRY